MSAARKYFDIQLKTVRHLEDECRHGGDTSFCKMCDELQVTLDHYALEMEDEPGSLDELKKLHAEKLRVEKSRKRKPGGSR